MIDFSIPDRQPITLGPDVLSYRADFLEPDSPFE